MPTQLEIVFRGLPSCSSLEALVRARATLLRAANPEPLVACRVVVDAAIETLCDAGRYRATVEVTLRSGRRVTAGSLLTSAGQAEPADAIDDAFDVAERAIDARPSSPPPRRSTIRLVRAAARDDDTAGGQRRLA